MVETTLGGVDGITRGGVLQFRGIPFAAPPVGGLRFRPPQPASPWSGVRLCDHWGAAAPQPRSMGGLLPERQETHQSEDCLTLNVFTSSTGSTGSEAGLRPVLYWIHGGGFTGGSGFSAWYNGTSFARRGCVVVTVNYRLGALGFLHLGDRLGDDFATTGNLGLLDQIAGLEWVRDNIEAFGGDPGNVTIFGESAGGMSVGALLGTPAAKGLFHKAIPQSGAASNIRPRERAAEGADRFLDLLGVDPLTAPVEQLLETQTAYLAETARGGVGSLGFSPTVDGVTLPEPPLEAVRAGLAAGVPLLVGTTRDEMTLFGLPDPAFRSLSDEHLLARVDRVDRGTGAALVDAYRRIRPDDPPRDLWTAIETDRVFRMPAIRLAEAQEPHEPRTYMYLFTWGSPAFDGALKSCHALEIPFAWNTLSVQGTDQFAGSGPGADALAEAMHASWVAFAHTGSPAHEGVPDWPAYEPGRRATMLFGRSREVADDPMSAERQVWPA